MESRVSAKLASVRTRTSESSARAAEMKRRAMIATKDKTLCIVSEKMKRVGVRWYTNRGITELREMSGDVAGFVLRSEGGLGTPRFQNKAQL